MAVPIQPISAMPIHSAESWPWVPSSTERTALVEHFSARNLRACSRSNFWSSEKSKFIVSSRVWNSGSRHDRGRKAPRQHPALNPDLMPVSYDVGLVAEGSARHGEGTIPQE